MRKACDAKHTQALLSQAFIPNGPMSAWYAHMFVGGLPDCQATWLPASDLKAFRLAVVRNAQHLRAIPLGALDIGVGWIGYAPRVRVIQAEYR